MREINNKREGNGSNRKFQKRQKTYSVTCAFHVLRLSRLISWEAHKYCHQSDCPFVMVSIISVLCAMCQSMTSKEVHCESLSYLMSVLSLSAVDLHFPVSRPVRVGITGYMGEETVSPSFSCFRDLLARRLVIGYGYRRSFFSGCQVYWDTSLNCCFRLLEKTFESSDGQGKTNGQTGVYCSSISIQSHAWFSLSNQRELSRGICQCPVLLFVKEHNQQTSWQVARSQRQMAIEKEWMVIALFWWENFFTGVVFSSWWYFLKRWTYSSKNRQT